MPVMRPEFPGDSLYSISLETGAAGRTRHGSDGQFLVRWHAPCGIHEQALDVEGGALGASIFQVRLRDGGGSSSERAIPQIYQGKRRPILSKFHTNAALIAEEDSGAFGGFERAAQ